MIWFSQCIWSFHVSITSRSIDKRSAHPRLYPRHEPGMNPISKLFRRINLPNQTLLCSLYAEYTNSSTGAVHLFRFHVWDWRLKWLLYGGLSRKWPTDTPQLQLLGLRSLQTFLKRRAIFSKMLQRLQTATSFQNVRSALKIELSKLS